MTQPGKTIRTFHDALVQLKHWCELSQGALITMPSGKSLRFSANTRHTIDSCHVAETDLNCEIPGAYQQFLMNIGSGTFFDAGVYASDGIEILDPFRIKTQFTDSFDHIDDWVGGQVLPVGLDHRLQEVAAYNHSWPAGQNFIVMSHEYYLDELQDHGNEPPGKVYTFEEWIIESVNTEGHNDAH